MQKNRLVKLEAVFSVSSNNGMTEKEIVFQEKFEKMTWLEKLQWSAESFYCEPLAENMARDTIKMNIEEYKAMIQGMSEQEIIDYLNDTYKAYASIKGTDQEIDQAAEKLSAEIINKVKAEKSLFI